LDIVEDSAGEVERERMKPSGGWLRKYVSWGTKHCMDGRSAREESRRVGCSGRGRESRETVKKTLLVHDVRSDRSGWADLDSGGPHAISV
jgi:hypothetical protein